MKTERIMGLLVELDQIASGEGMEYGLPICGASLPQMFQVVEEAMKPTVEELVTGLLHTQYKVHRAEKQISWIYIETQFVVPKAVQVIVEEQLVNHGHCEIHGTRAKVNWS